MLSSNRILFNLVDIRTAELECSAPVTKQALCLPLQVVMALEVAVMDVSLELFWRAFAWTRLVKVWTASRADHLGWHRSRAKSVLG